MDAPASSPGTANRETADSADAERGSASSTGTETAETAGTDADVSSPTSTATAAGAVEDVYDPVSGTSVYRYRDPSDPGVSYIYDTGTRNWVRYDIFTAANTNTNANANPGGAIAGSTTSSVATPATTTADAMLTACHTTLVHALLAYS